VRRYPLALTGPKSNRIFEVRMPMAKKSKAKKTKRKTKSRGKPAGKARKTREKPTKRKRSGPARKRRTAKKKRRTASRSRGKAAAPTVPNGGEEEMGLMTDPIAERLAKEQREISVSEFFTKNRHLLGFDNPKKALLTAVKEAVDNSLDACEEARIQPEIKVEISPLSDDRYRTYSASSCTAASFTSSG
jgi:DNA topoisomerase-6 subunit B